MYQCEFKLMLSKDINYKRGGVIGKSLKCSLRLVWGSWPYACKVRRAEVFLTLISKQSWVVPWGGIGRRKGSVKKRRGHVLAVKCFREPGVALVRMCHEDPT